MKKVKIFIACHKETDLIKSEVFNPIKVGAKQNEATILGALSDNDGENISQLNPKFCELTAQYWALKNDKSDCVGFFHYRRYLSFAKKRFREDSFANVVESARLADCLDKYCLQDTEVLQVVKEYDIILPKIKDIRSMPKMGRNMREQYSKDGSLKAKDLTLAYEVLVEKYPDFKPDADKFLEGHKAYFNNMFIMRRDIFEQYGNWLFDILFEVEKRMDYSGYDIEAMRTLGHLGERLLNIYILHLRRSAQYKIKELQTVFFKNIERAEALKPAFNKRNNAIVLAANDYYAPYIASIIASIKAHANKKENYDIIIMHANITGSNQKTIQKLAEHCNNFSIRFLSVVAYEDKFRKLFTRGHFTIETWFRLLMPELLETYQKVLYLDADMIVMDDVAKLYATDVNGFLLAAAKDPDTAGLYNGFEPYKKRYMDKELGLKNPYNYFQAGVILFNLAAFRKKFSSAEMLKVASSKRFELLDQDVLNILAEDKVKFIDMAWNVMYDWKFERRSKIISLAPKELSNAYDAAHAAPKIIHYAGPEKPWHNPACDFGEVFWQYAKVSGFYDVIQKRYEAYRREQEIKKSKPILALKHRVKKIIKEAFLIIAPEGSWLHYEISKLYNRMRH